MELMSTNCNVQNNDGVSQLQDFVKMLLLFVDYA